MKSCAFTAAIAMALGLCASASGAVTVRSTSFIVPEPGSGGIAIRSGTASCGKGETVSAAGFSGQVNDTQATFLTAMAPSATGVKFSSSNPGATGTVTGRAYCSAPDKAKKKKKNKKKKSKKGASKSKKKKGKKKKRKAAPPPVVATRTVSTSGPMPVSATATCPAGRIVRAGGFDTTATADAQWHLSELEMPTPTSITATVKRYGFDGDPTTMTAIALCGSGPALTAAPGNAAAIPGAGAATSTATCPAGKKVAWVGVTEGNFGGSYMTGLGRASDSTATATGYALSSSQTIKAIAYCG